MSAKRPHEAPSDSNNDAKRTRLAPFNGYDNNTESTPEVDKHLIKNWGLDDQIVQFYESKNITKFFPWQVEALELPGVLDKHKNLIFTAPTSAGKTMVSDMLLYKTVLERKKKVIVVLPLVALAMEKAESLKNVLKRIGGLKVVQMAGDAGPRVGFDLVDVAVCTIEKANNLINRLVEDGKLSEVGLIIVDELHMLGEKNRGYLLEILLTKILYHSEKSSDSVQIVGMSATMSNLSEIASWLKAEQYLTNFRPVKLFQRIAFPSSHSRDKWVTLVDELDDNNQDFRFVPKPNIKHRYRPLIKLAIDTMIEGHSALIFCSRRPMCEEKSLELAKNVIQNRQNIQLNTAKLEALIQMLKKSPSGCLSENLETCLRQGVAYHHAMMTTEEKTAIEEAFRNCHIKLLCCTSTLASGVNLPARRVLIASAFNGVGNPITSEAYHQMIGRAGRQGIDYLGESYIFCDNFSAIDITRSLICSGLEPIQSQLFNENEGSKANLEKMVIEIMSDGTVNCKADIVSYCKRTFYAGSRRFKQLIFFDKINFEPIVDKVLANLVDKGFVYKDGNNLNCSKLSKAIAASGLHPKEGQLVMNELSKAMKSLSLETDLHLIYLVTPTYTLSYTYNDMKDVNYGNIFKNLSPSEENIAKQIEIDINTEDKLVLQRFCVALALNDLIQGQSIVEVSNKYGLLPVKIQEFKKNISAFAGMVGIFCNKLGWHNLEILIESLQPRLVFGIPHELVDLMKITFLPIKIAKTLHKSYSKLQDLIYAKVEDIEKTILDGLPFEANETVDPKKREIFIPELSQHSTVSDLAKKIYDEVRDISQMEIRIQAFDNIASKLSNIALHESEYLEKFDKDFVSSLPECFRKLEVNFNEISTVFVDTEAAIKQLIAFFDNEDSLNLVVHFVTKPVTELPKQLIQLPNSQNPNPNHFDSERMIIEDGNSFELSEMFITKPGEKTVFKIHTKSMFELFQYYLQQVLKKDSMKSIRILTYDMKLTIHIFVRGFKLSFDEHTKKNVEFFDLKVAIWLLDPEAPKFSISNLSIKNLLSVTQTYRLDLKFVGRIEQLSNQQTLTSDIETVKTILLPELLPNFCQKLIDNNLYKSYRYIEIPSRISFSAPEISGVSFDLQVLEEQKAQLVRLMELYETEVFKIVDQKFDIGNPIEVKKVLESTLRQSSNRTGSVLELHNTDKVALMKLQTYLGKESKLPTLIMNWRTMKYSLECIQSILNSLKDNGKVYVEFSEWTKTGRITMGDPNLINFPKEYEIEDLDDIDHLSEFKQFIDSNKLNSEAEKSLLTIARKLFSTSASASKKTVINLRNFVVAREGYCLISADYKQLELRLLAHLSNDESLKQTLNDLSADVFKSIAAACQKIKPEEVKPEGRQMAKKVCYGIIYGMGDKKLAEELNLTEKESKEFKESFLKSYPRIREFIEQKIDDCKKNEFVETLENRRRLLPNINSSDREKQSEACRQAVNTTIQGSAADCAKLAMLAIDWTIRERKMNASLVLQMHDELMYEVRDNGTNAEEFAKIFKNQMESVAKYLEVSLPVNVKRGKRWGSLEEITEL